MESTLKYDTDHRVLSKKLDWPSHPTVLLKRLTNSVEMDLMEYVPLLIPVLRPPVLQLLLTMDVFRLLESGI